MVVTKEPLEERFKNSGARPADGVGDGGDAASAAPRTMTAVSEDNDPEDEVVGR